MAFKESVAVRNARLDAIETAIGQSPVLKIRTGVPPANVATADTGTVLATVNLPPNWMNAASGGVKQMSGAWSDNAADAAGDAGHFRIYAAGGTVAHLQGTCGESGTDMIVDEATFVINQPFNITSFQITAGNA